MRYFLLIRAKVIQLWHGIPIKQIELEHWRHETGRYKWAARPSLLWLRLIIYRITGRWIRYAAVVATSSYYRDNVFARAFLAHHFPVAGYPRNEFAQSLQGKNRDLAWSNVDPIVKSNLPHWKSLGRKLILVAPTFRDSGSAPMQLDAATLLAIDTFAEANAVEFLFKFHPSERNIDYVPGRHFHLCARDSDVYPLLPYTAALVTDYSSIGLDYLLLDKPLLFLVPERDDYASNSREFQFEPRTMMPGPIVPDWSSLLEALQTTLASDAYKQARAKLRSQAFEDLPQAEAVSKLIAFMRQRGWLAAPSLREH
jgi:CDP-glycerol glycerophosphotransferase (TagB/SpsB family)